MQSKDDKVVDDDTLTIIQRVAKRLAYKYTFAFYDVEDIEQEAIIIGLAGLKDYDGQRPLENFLAVHINNRLKNFKRDNFVRHDIICDSCKDLETSEYCAACINRLHTANAKRNLYEPLVIDDVDADDETNMQVYDHMLTSLDTKEALALIDANLDGSLRADYLRFKDGVFLPKKRKERVMNAVSRILKENGYDS